MPYARPTLSDLRTRIWSDITGAASGIVMLLQKAVLRVLGTVFAGAVSGLYGYLDWIANQAVPFTSEDEYLAAWGALKNVYLEAAVPTELQVGFTNCAPGAAVDENVSITRQDNTQYLTVGNATVAADGTVTLTVQAVIAGSAANCSVGVQLSLGQSVDGMQSTGTVTAIVTEGADVETQDSFRGRVIDAFQEPAQGGDANDYVTWARAVAGVTRAWCTPNGFGAGTVVVYFMMDEAEASNGGFPQGADGVSQYDQGPNGQPRGVIATGDQLEVADALIDEQPVTALVYLCSPIKNAIGFTISGLSAAGSTTQSAVESELSDLFYRNGVPKGTINWSDITAAVSSVTGTSGYLITAVTSTVSGTTTDLAPNANLVMSAGELPVLGTVNFD